MALNAMQKKKIFISEMNQFQIEWSSLNNTFLRERESEKKKRKKALRLVDILYFPLLLDDNYAKPMLLL